MDGYAKATGTRTPERRMLPDRRARPTTFWSALRWRGRRRGFRRAGEGHGTYVDCPALRVVVLTLGVFLASLVDAGLTLRQLAQGGSEANLLMAWVLTKGDALFLGLKLGMTGLGMWFLAAHQQFTLARYGLSILALVYGVLLSYHALLLGSE
jgi:Domain of unknown function (DUF5658)